MMSGRWRSRSARRGLCGEVAPKGLGAARRRERRAAGGADVNVLVSVVRTPKGLCGRLLDAAAAQHWTPVISLILLEELEDVLARPAFKDVIGEEAIERFLADLLAIAEWASDPEDEPTAQTRDPDDDYLLALAHSAQVDALVSGDRDLTDLVDTEPPIETPAEFSRRLAD